MHNTRQKEKSLFWALRNSTILWKTYRLSQSFPSFSLEEKRVGIAFCLMWLHTNWTPLTTISLLWWAWPELREVVEHEEWIVINGVWSHVKTPPPPLPSLFKRNTALQGFSQGEIKGVDWIHLLPKYLAMHIWLSIIMLLWSRQKGGGREKRRGTKKKKGNPPPAFLQAVSFHIHIPMQVLGLMCVRSGGSL